MRSSTPKEPRANAFRLITLLQLLKCQTINQDADLDASIDLVHRAVLDIHRLGVPVAPHELLNAYRAAVDALAKSKHDPAMTITQWLADLQKFGEPVVASEYYRELAASPPVAKKPKNTQDKPSHK